MPGREQWEALQSRLRAARLNLQANQLDAALAEIDAALGVDPDFVAALSLREQILPQSKIEPVFQNNEPLAASASAPYLAAPSPEQPGPAPPVSSEAFARFEARARQRRIEKRLAAANDAIAARRFADARDALEEVRTLDPERVECAALAARLDGAAQPHVPGRRAWRRLAAVAALLALLVGGSLLAFRLDFMGALRPSEPSRAAAPARADAPAPSPASPERSVSPEPQTAFEETATTGAMDARLGDVTPETRRQSELAGAADASLTTPVVATASDNRPVENVWTVDMSSSPPPPATPPVMPVMPAGPVLPPPPSETARVVVSSPVEAETAESARLLPSADPPSVSIALPPPAAPDASPPVAEARPPRETVLPSDAARDDRLIIMQALQRYRTAYEALDARSARAVWPSVNEAALGRAFDALESQRLTFDDCQVQLRGAAATANCSGSARYTTKVGRRQLHVEPRAWSFTLRKIGEDWKIDSARTR